MYRLRGYSDRRYDDNTPTGLVGNSYLLSNTELRYRLPNNKNIEIVAFYDIGKMNNTDTVKSDYGTGFRFSIPMLGLIRLDQAWNIDGGTRTVFSLGELF
jgi:outer membrane protein insertion porin family